MGQVPYNPLDKLNLGRSVAEALLLCPVLSLSDLDSVVGAGVYAIYYTGPFLPYAPISKRNLNQAFEQPIYVGKAVPEGARKGGLSLAAATGTSMRKRLKQHRASIDEVSNLESEDFHCRVLVVDDIWIPLGENMMIELFKPIWNLVIDGFGNKVPGINRPQTKSRWDILHPGRKLTRNLIDSGITGEMVVEQLRRFFAGQPIQLPVNQSDDRLDQET